ncbi:DUF262 domain-containing protein [Psychrobacillus sp. NPDC096389]|uniref:GmrSD restriction endonuclease domain-containing protein n=1 Tax=Psychrobacillus sp. NPDC096389 TaxID=3364490 RepID=UPI003826328D
MQTPTTFWQLVSSYEVKIPLIQRDYAQGRSDERTVAIREVLLLHLQEAIQGNRQVDFDFVYGSVNEGILTPLDGQQRLTTLFLLHWYFSVKEDIDLHDKLQQFSYETRISARDFCREIVKNPIDFELLIDQRLSRFIRGEKWFQHHWLQDPTVEGMLIMLDAMHEQYSEIDVPVIPLLQSDNCPITFSFLELRQFGLSDELYIKMNARGKALTDFENFKAQFEQILEGEGFQKESKEFSHLLDSKWTDLLWGYRASDNTIDKVFVNLFSFITSALASKEVLEKDPRIFSDTYLRPSILKRIYAKKENIKFLFDTLDLWKNKADIERDFLGIQQKIPWLFYQTNLIELCVNNRLSLVDRILLYTIIQKKRYGQEFDLEDTLRIIRNLVHRIRQASAGKYTSNLRFDSIGQILRTIDNLVLMNKPVYEALQTIKTASGFSGASLVQEKEKADLIIKNPQIKKLLHELEDIMPLHGAVHQLLPVFKSYPDETVKLTKELVKEDKLLARAMLTIEDYDLHIGWSNLGSRYVLCGSMYREYIWTNSKDLSGMYKQLFELLIATPKNTVRERLLYLIEHENTEQKTSWLYYCIKYPTMLKGNNVLYVFENSNADTFQIERLTGVNLQSEHINPFYDTVIQQINDSSICTYSQTVARLSEKSKLKTNCGITFWISNGKWHYAGDEDICASVALLDENLEDVDFIERGVALVKHANQVATISV